MPRLTLTLALTLTLSLSFSAFSQIRPVLITPQLVPPYSVYLADYATPGNDKLRLVVLQRDVTRPFYQIRLQMSVQLNGNVVLRTSPAFNPAPITVSSGAPLIISGIDLQPYLDSRNLVFSGINREAYERTKALPEGSYQICFTAYDYNRQDVAVSETGCNFFWLAKSEPPMLNFPACGTALPLHMPQQVVFSWLPRNTASGNSADDTEYEFTLYETRPAGRNPNDVVLSAQPMYRTTTALTQLMYSAAEPLLLDNMTYVWRVRAIDKSGKDLFRNNGYSETCTFTYGTVDSSIQLAPVDGLQAQAEAGRKAKASWTAQQAEGYKVYYKKAGSAYQWFSRDTPQNALALMDLEPNTDYEIRVLSYVGAAYGPYSNIVKFKTPQKRVAQCGDQLPVIAAAAQPIAFASRGMIINVQGIDLTLTDVQGPTAAGVYAGKGQVTVPYLGASFNVIFKDLFIDENQTASRGRIDFITRQVDEWIDDEVEKQKKEALEAKQEQNRETWKDTDFYDKVIYYTNDPIADVTADAAGQVTITTADGRSIPDPQIAAILKDAPEKAIIIEDKNGEQWVVQKDPATGQTKVTKVDGGGLSPNNAPITDEALNMVRQALISLHTEYNDQKLQTIDQELQQKQKALDDYLDAHNTPITETITTSPNGDVIYSALLIDFEAEEKITEDPRFLALSAEKENKEIEQALALLLQLLNQEDNIQEITTLVTRELRINNKPISDYLKSQQTTNTPDDVLLQKTKEEITTLLTTVLTNSPLENPN